MFFQYFRVRYSLHVHTYAIIYFRIFSFFSLSLVELLHAQGLFFFFFQKLTNLMFVLAPEVVFERRNSTKPTTKIPIEDPPLDMNSAAMYNYYNDPNVPAAKSAACIIL